MSKEEKLKKEKEEEEIPVWVRESLKNAALVEFMFLAFEERCDCKVCQKLRDMAKAYQTFLEEFISKK